MPKMPLGGRVNRKRKSVLEQIQAHPRGSVTLVHRPGSPVREEPRMMVVRDSSGRNVRAQVRWSDNVLRVGALKSRDFDQRVQPKQTQQSAPKTKPQADYSSGMPESSPQRQPVMTGGPRKYGRT